MHGFTCTRLFKLGNLVRVPYPSPDGFQTSSDLFRRVVIDVSLTILGKSGGAPDFYGNSPLIKKSVESFFPLDLLCPGGSFFFYLSIQSCQTTLWERLYWYSCLFCATLLYLLHQHPLVSRRLFNFFLLWLTKQFFFFFSFFFRPRAFRCSVGPPLWPFFSTSAWRPPISISITTSDSPPKLKSWPHRRPTHCRSLKSWPRCRPID